MVIFQRMLILLLLSLSGGHITLLGMDNPAPETFACDWCQEQKETLNKYGPEKACKGIDCTHILCNSCDAALSKKYSALPEDQRFFYCHRCRAFYTERNKVCWFKDTSGWSGVESFADVTAQYFKEQYGQEAGARQLPLATADTVLPNSANKSTVRLVVQPDHQRRYTCQHCHTSPEKIIKITRFLNAGGYCQQNGTVSQKEQLSDAYYCKAHEDTKPAINAMDTFKQKCQGLYPQAKWRTPFPLYDSRKELINNPILAHGNPSGNQKHSISKLYPLGFIGLLAAGAAIYYYRSSDQEEKNDEQDEEDTAQSDQINEGSNEVA